MVKVRVLQNLGVGVAGAAALVGTGAGTMGCGVQSMEDQGAQAAADTEMTAAGTGSISLHYYDYTYVSTSGGDEFVRAGEKLALNVDFLSASYLLSSRNWDAGVRVANDPAKLKASFRVSYQYADGREISKVSLPVTWTTQGGVVKGATDGFVVPSGAPHMVLTLVVEEVGGQAAVAEGGADMYRHSTFAVFGAFADNKLVLFDNDEGGRARQRIVEGGALTPGKDVTLSFSDWRADRVADKATIDTTIGDGHSYSRFGTVNITIKGEIQYEIDFVYSTDGGQTWQSGGTLTAHKNPDVLNVPDGTYRAAYEKTFKLPANAQDLEVAFHVKAFLLADPHYQYVDRWRNNYQLGGRYLMRDVWDNNGGQNYKVAAKR